MSEKTHPPAPKLHDLFVTRLYRAEKIVPAKLRAAGFSFADPNLEPALRRIIATPSEHAASPDA